MLTHGNRYFSVGVFIVEMGCHYRPSTVKGHCDMIGKFARTKEALQRFSQDLDRCIIGDGTSRCRSKKIDSSARVSGSQPEYQNSTHIKMKGGRVAGFEEGGVRQSFDCGMLVPEPSRREQDDDFLQ
jgi:hypothetical protein